MRFVTDLSLRFDMSSDIYKIINTQCYYIHHKRHKVTCVYKLLQGQNTIPFCLRATRYSCCSTAL